jgi:hypothetical protein
VPKSVCVLPEPGASESTGCAGAASRVSAARTRLAVGEQRAVVAGQRLV